MKSISRSGRKRVFSSPPRSENPILLCDETISSSPLLLPKPSKRSQTKQADVFDEVKEQEDDETEPTRYERDLASAAMQETLTEDQFTHNEADGRIRVFIRFREDACKRDACVLRDPDNPRAVIYVPSSAATFHGQKLNLKVFTFDDVLDSQASQEEVFNVVARPIVDRFLQGFNGAILAYGQSGSGKTYTIEGALTDETRRGIVARVGEAIFRHLEALESNSRRCVLEASLVEVYCEKLKDLLSKEGDKRQLKIRETLDGSCEVEGATKVLICNENALLAVLLSGQQRRSIGETALNTHSSRSHSVLNLSLLVEDRQDGIKQHSNLYFVDLAGSERAAKSRCEGVKFEEGKNINQSLTTLGIVINALSNKESFIPYRDSKLTRILRGALGGNSLTALICCISTSRLNEFETLSTLKFGQRCARITNTVYKEYIHTNESLEKKHEILLREIEALTTYATSLELWISSVGLKLPSDIFNARSAAMSLPDLEIPSPDTRVDVKHQTPSSRASSVSSSSCDVETTCFPAIQSRNVALSRIGSSEREMRSSDNRSVITHRMSFVNSFIDDDVMSIPRPLSIETAGSGPHQVPCEVSPVVALVSLQRQYQDLACRHAECKTDLYKAEAELMMKDEQIETLEESLRSAHEQYNILLSQYERISTRSIASQPSSSQKSQPESSVSSSIVGVKKKATKDLCANHRHDHSHAGRSSIPNIGHTGDQAHMDQSIIMSSSSIKQILSPPTPPRSHYP